MSETRRSDASQFVIDFVLASSLYTISTVIQRPRERLLQMLDAEPTVVINGEQRFSGGVMKQFIAYQVRQHGVSVFFRRTVAQCVLRVPASAGTLALNDLCRNRLHDASSSFWKSLSTNIVCAGMASAIANTVCYPFRLSAVAEMVRKVSTFTLWSM
jgi:hypothetical protein